MIHFSEDYNAQTIFEQVWESPYPWFRLVPKLTDELSWLLPAKVAERDDYGKDIEVFNVTVEAMEEAVIKYYLEYLSKSYPTKSGFIRTMADYFIDLDANDVDGILQLAIFKEIRYS